MTPSALLARLRPRSIAGQIALLVVAAIVVAHAVATTAFVLLREPWRPDDHPGVAANRLAVVIRMLDEATPQERPALLKHAAAGLPFLHIAPWDGTGPTAATDPSDHPVVQRMRDGAGRPLTVTNLTEGAGHLRIGVTSPRGAALQASLPDEPFGPSRQGAIVFTVVFLGLTLALLTMWAARALTAPLARLARSAEAFGTASDPVAPPRRGPKEVLAVSRALDRMRERVRRLIDDRTQMLAAISHDLRTPITRLRLRAEFIEDEHVRTLTLRDLDQMNSLVEAALSFVRDGQGGAAGGTTLFDLASVVQTVCDGFVDMGSDVRVGENRHILVRGKPEELQRAVTNLVDNAIKYGGRAELTISAGPRTVFVDVCDAGPGIPEEEREVMLQPFVRGDRARNLNGASGFGLGLSIVLAIVEAHHGRLVLSNRPEGGLSARIELPLAAQGAPPQTSDGQQTLAEAAE